MRLLVDEMYSTEIAVGLRAHGVDAVSVHEVPDLEGSPDPEVLRRGTRDRRAVVTNNVRHFAPLVEVFGLSGENHYGAVFTDDATFPRGKNGIGRLVLALAAFAAGRPDDDLMDSCLYLEPA